MTWADFYLSDYNEGFISEDMNPPKSTVYDYLNSQIMVSGGISALMDFNTGEIITFGDMIQNNRIYYINISGGYG